MVSQDNLIEDYETKLHLLEERVKLLEKEKHEKLYDQLFPRPPIPLSAQSFSSPPPPPPPPPTPTPPPSAPLTPCPCSCHVDISLDLAEIKKTISSMESEISRLTSLSASHSAPITW